MSLAQAPPAASPLLSSQIRPGESSGGRAYQILPKNPAVLASSNILQFTFQFISLTTMDEISAIVIDNGSGACKAGCKSYCLRGVVYL